MAPPTYGDTVRWEPATRRLGLVRTIVVLQTILGTNDDDQYSLRVIRRIAGRQGAIGRTDVPGIIFLEIAEDG